MPIILIQNYITCIENLKTTAMTAYNQDKRALYDRWQKPGDRAQYKKITSTVSDNETAPMTSRYVQKENTLSGESISLPMNLENRNG